VSHGRMTESERENPSCEQSSFSRPLRATTRSSKIASRSTNHGVMKIRIVRKLGARTLGTAASGIQTSGSTNYSPVKIAAERGIIIDAYRCRQFRRLAVSIASKRTTGARDRDGTPGCRRSRGTGRRRVRCGRKRGDAWRLTEIDELFY